MKKKRLEFAKKHINWSIEDCKKVLFSDKSTFEQFIVEKNHVRAFWCECTMNGGEVLEDELPIHMAIHLSSISFMMVPLSSAEICLAVFNRN